MLRSKTRQRRHPAGLTTLTTLKGTRRIRSLSRLMRGVCRARHAIVACARKPGCLKANGKVITPTIVRIRFRVRA